MALVATGLQPQFSMSFQDNNGNTSSMSFSFATATNTLALALTAGNALRDAVANLTNARILGGTVSFPLVEDAPTAWVPESEVERKLYVPFVGPNGRVVYSSEVPSPLFGLETAGTDIIDVANAAIAAYLVAVTTNARSNRGEALTSPLAGAMYIAHRGRGRRR